MKEWRIETVLERLHLSITSKAIIFISQTCKKIKEMRKIMEYIQMFLKLTDSRRQALQSLAFLEIIHSHYDLFI